jgi:hypothetical protein
MAARSASPVAVARRGLVCHPASVCPEVEAVTVQLSLRSREVLVRYDIVGDLGRLRIPRPDAPLDPDRLWAHTCAELFVAPAAGDGYREWNFSPTGQWAVFDFSSYRQRAPAGAPVGQVVVSASVDPGALRIEARVALPADFGASVRVSLTTVIEDAAGGLSYWAVRHPCDQPDFHHAEGFALACNLSPTPEAADATESP